MFYDFQFIHVLPSPCIINSNQKRFKRNAHDVPKTFLTKCQVYSIRRSEAKRHDLIIYFTLVFRLHFGFHLNIHQLCLVHSSFPHHFVGYQECRLPDRIIVPITNPIDSHIIKGGKNMAYSIDSKVKDLRKSEAASDIIAQYTPGFKTDPQMKLVGALTFRKLCSFPQAGLSAEQLAEIDEKLKALG